MRISVISMIREPWGGSEELWFAMAREALAKGHQVTHVSFDFDTAHPRLEEFRRLGGISLQRPGYYPPTLSPKGRLIRTVVNFIKKKLRPPFSAMFRQKPDIVIYNGTCYSISQEKELLKQLAATSCRFFIIGHLNNETDRGFSNAAKNIILAAYDRAEKVYFVSQRSADVARRQLCRDIPNAAVVRNPVNIKDTSPISFPEISNVQWATVGNLLTAHKGQDILLSVLQQPHWRQRDWTLNIYGDGPDREYLKELVSFYQLGDKAIIHGKVSDIRKVWSTNHLLLMPSHMEGMPLAIVEAMLCGRPCIASDVGGAAEWIEDNVSGFLAPAATIPALDAVMEKAWQQRDQWEAIGLRAHHRALDLYDPAPGKTLLGKLIKP